MIPAKRCAVKNGSSSSFTAHLLAAKASSFPPMTTRKPKQRAITASPARVTRGRAREDAQFTAVTPAVDMPEGYGSLLSEIKSRLTQARLRTVLAANAAMVVAYWDVGCSILARQQAEGWGAKVIDRLSADLRRAFPDMSGLSPRNLKYMRAFAAAWPDGAIVQEALAQIGWYQNIALLDKLKTPQERLWYAQHAVQHGWSHSILTLQIESQAHQRSGKAQNNFSLTLPPADSDLAAQIFKDPYLFDFIGTGDPRREREVEQALVDHIQLFLLELGAGFAFVGKQVHLEVGGQIFLSRPVVLSSAAAALCGRRAKEPRVSARRRRADESLPLRSGRFAPSRR